MPFAYDGGARSVCFFCALRPIIWLLAEKCVILHGSRRVDK